MLFCLFQIGIFIMKILKEVVIWIPYPSHFVLKKLNQTFLVTSILKKFLNNLLQFVFIALHKKNIMCRFALPLAFEEELCELDCMDTPLYYNRNVRFSARIEKIIQGAAS